MRKFLMVMCLFATMSSAFAGNFIISIGFPVVLVPLPPPPVVVYYPPPVVVQTVIVPRVIVAPQPVIYVHPRPSVVIVRPIPHRIEGHWHHPKK